MFHDFLESSIVLFELFAFFFKLLLDVLIAYEDTLEIHPLLLDLKPHFNALRNEVKGSFPIPNFTREGTCVLV